MSALTFQRCISASAIAKLLRSNTLVIGPKCAVTSTRNICSVRNSPNVRGTARARRNLSSAPPQQPPTPATPVTPHIPTSAAASTATASTSSTASASSSMRAPISWRGVTFLGVLGASLFVYLKQEYDEQIKHRTTKIEYYGKPSLGGPFCLVDDRGRGVTDASYQGAFTLIYFGFSHCPDICPSELVKVGRVLKELERRDEVRRSKGKGALAVSPAALVQTLYVSLDPARDSVGQLAHYAQDFHPSVRFLTGTTEQVAKAARAYRVFFMKADESESDEEEYLVDHSIVFYLNGPNGEFLDFFSQNFTALDMTDKIEAYMLNYIKDHPDEAVAAAQRLETDRLSK